MQVAAMQTLSRPLVAARPAVRARTTLRARNVQVFAAADRATWYPGAKPPKYLDGTMAGDYGFDPLRLGAQPERLAWYKAAERYNGRVAMMAVVGILFTDLVGLPTWWTAGAEVDLPFGGLVPLIAIEAAVFAVLESFRFNSWKKTGEMDGIGPIIPFDPMGMNSAETATKEIKNARLAMVAFLGFSSQAAVRGLGPIECLKLHLENPGYNNIFTSDVGTEATVAVIALSIAPMIIQARRSISGGKSDDDELTPVPF